MPRINWVEALKQITGQKRRDRAVKRYLEYTKHGKPPGNPRRQLEHGRREGFTPYEIDYLQHHFLNWLNKPKHKKGKQGRRISDFDGRLRTALLGLIPRKPQKRS